MIIDNLCLKDLESISRKFLTEIEKSSAGEKTSLGFMVHDSPTAPLIKANENFQIMVIGGSIFKKALLKKTENRIEIIKNESEKNICFENSDDFLELVYKELYPDINTLILNFAYPLKPVYEKGRLDGILLKESKENKFHNLIGKKVGQEVEKYFFSKTNKKILVAVENDTACLLASGLDRFNEENLACGIAGTGLNFAFFLNKNKFVNLESANFDKFSPTETGKIIDKISAQIGSGLFEKETAGAYLYKHFNLILKQNNIDYPHISSTEELDKISRKNISSTSQIAQSLLRKSAQLIACQIAGIVLFKQRDMTFIMEGSLFWKANKYKEVVIETVNKLVSKFKVDFVEIENSSILGAAKLVS